MSRKWAILTCFLFTIQPVYAAVEVNLGQSIGQVGRWLSDIFSNDYATFGVVIIVLTILLRSIFAASLRRVKIFEGAGGEGIGPMGNTVAWTMAIMASIGLFYLKGQRNVSVFLERILGPGSMWAAIIILIVLFMWLKGATGSVQWALLLTGLASMSVSNMVAWSALATGGLFMIIVGFFWLIGSVVRSGRPATVRDERRAERAERKLTNALDNTIRDTYQERGDLGAAKQLGAAEEKLTAKEESNAVQEGDWLRAMARAVAAAGPNLTGQNAPRFAQYQSALLRELRAELSAVQQIVQKERDASSKLAAIKSKVRDDMLRVLEADSMVKQMEKDLSEKDYVHAEQLSQELRALKTGLDETREYQKTIKIIMDLDNEMKKANQQVIDNLMHMNSLLSVNFYGQRSDAVLTALTQVENLKRDNSDLYKEKERLVQEYERYTTSAVDDSQKIADNLARAERLSKQMASQEKKEEGDIKASKVV